MQSAANSKKSSTHVLIRRKSRGYRRLVRFGNYVGCRSGLGIVSVVRRAIAVFFDAVHDDSKNLDTQRRQAVASLNDGVDLADITEDRNYGSVGVLGNQQRIGDKQERRRVDHDIIETGFELRFERSPAFGRKTLRRELIPLTGGHER